MSKPSLGEQELQLLRFIAEQGPISVGEMAERFGVPRGLSRSTVVTMMDRLRLKGYLVRTREEGAYRYTSALAREELLSGLVQNFVEKTLAGSLAPFITYFSRSSKLSEAEIAELRHLVDKLESREEE